MKEHLSASQIRSLLDGYGKTPPCPARVVAVQEGRWKKDPPSDAMLAGSYLDAILTTGTGAEWKAKHPDCISSRGPTKGEVKSIFKSAERLAERVKSIEIWPILQAADSQVDLSGEIAGVPVKGKADWISHEEKLIVDLKKRADFADEWHCINGRNRKLPWWFEHLEQMTIYQDLVEQLTGEVYECAILGASENKSIHYLVYDNQLIELYLPRLEERIYLADRTKKSERPCYVCEFCAKTFPMIGKSANITPDIIDAIGCEYDCSNGEMMEASEL